MTPTLALRRLGIKGCWLAMLVALVPICGGRIAAAVEPAQLEALRADLEAEARVSAGLYQEAGRLLVQLAEAELPGPKLRSESVARVRSVAQSSSELAARTRQLSAALEPIPVGISGSAKHLAEALSRHRAAAMDFGRQVDELRTDLDAARSAVSSDDLARGAQAFVVSAPEYEKAAGTLAGLVSDLQDIIVGRTRESQGVRLSVYGFLDDQGAGAEGYGLYTYVLFSTPSDRNAALMEILLHTPADELFADQQAAINLFALPVSSRIKARLVARTSASVATAIVAPNVYDYVRAERILGQVCLGVIADPPDLCKGQWQGPFLLTHSQPLSGTAAIPPPYLLVDLSNVSDSAFGEFVRAVKEQVMLPDFTSREKIDTFRLQMLDVTLKAADWLGPVKESVGEILAMVKGG